MTQRTESTAPRGMNTLKGSRQEPNPLRDLRVRRAIALAIDRKTIIESRLAGNADLVDELVAPDVFGAHRSLAPRPFNLAEARRLLATARPAGVIRMPLDFVPGRYPNIEGVAEAIGWRSSTGDAGTTFENLVQSPAALASGVLQQLLEPGSGPPSRRGRATHRRPGSQGAAALWD